MYPRLPSIGLPLFDLPGHHSVPARVDSSFFKPAKAAEADIGSSLTGNNEPAKAAPLDLSQWNARLSKQFTSLREFRQPFGDLRPVFALEHGLNNHELVALSQAIKNHIANRPPSKEHGLAWVVYAAEIGYRYSGDEYWQTFEDETPGWLYFGERHWIRRRFEAFRDGFGAAEPRGAWADHFSIICWPITHAILPRDLQRELAQVLYDIRHNYCAEVFESPILLGDFIASRSGYATSRFQNLAQEPQLLGQIAAALLLQDRVDSDLIYPDTLRRISGDLDQERRSREWLVGARKTANERAKIKGLGLGRRSPSARLGSADDARSEIERLGIEPRVVLRPTTIDRSAWDVLLEIPDLSHIPMRFPQTRDILASSRCTVAGASGRPLASGRLLHGSQRVVMERWPRPDEVLLQFERSDPQLEYLLRTECLLRPANARLFRIASDGLGYESRSLGVRAGETYIIVYDTGDYAVNSRCTPVVLKCANAKGAVLQIPNALSSEWIKDLESLGLGLSKKIEVWPSGLAAVSWDGEGHGEWLTSEKPCLGIRADHSIESLQFSIGATPALSLDLRDHNAGETIFLELPQLPVGMHTIRLSGRTAKDGPTELIGELDVVIRIRSAQPWTAGLNRQGPLLAQIDPVSPTLEQLWEGKVDISFLGPTSRAIRPHLALYDRSNDAPSVTRSLPPLSFPVTADKWRRHFKDYFRNVTEIEAAYDTASRCSLDFSAEDLGALSIQCAREFSPIRWALAKKPSGHFLRLVDDSGNEVPPVVTRYSFEAPTWGQKIDLKGTVEVPHSGGLFVATSTTVTRSILVPPIVTQLSDLGCVPSVPYSDRSVKSVINMLTLCEFWGKARVPGDFISVLRQHVVLKTLIWSMVEMICGERWTKAEGETSASNLSLLAKEVSRHGYESAIGNEICLHHRSLAEESREEKIRFLAQLASRFMSSSLRKGSAMGPEWFAELAVGLFSSPTHVKTWAGGVLDAGVLALLQELPELARAARLLVIITDTALESRTAPGELYAGWGPL
jgi:hypothetical protein